MNLIAILARVLFQNDSVQDRSLTDNDNTTHSSLRTMRALDGLYGKDTRIVQAVAEKVEVGS